MMVTMAISTVYILQICANVLVGAPGSLPEHEERTSTYCPLDKACGVESVHEKNEYLDVYCF